MVLDEPRSQIAHLLRRAGFGASEADVDQYVGLGFPNAVERLLYPEQVDNSAREPLFAAQALDPSDAGARRQVGQARVYWLTRMLHTQRPLEEKLALFWHGHFATASSKVNNALLLLDQIQLFREYGFGSFEVLLQKVTRNPAMLIWLDNRLNRRGAPNENYAREVQELFTLGIGNYTEQDIKEAARALTGHTLDHGQHYVFNADQHDGGDKTFHGQTGPFDADDILAILVRQPAAARFVTGKLFAYFVHDHPDASTIDRLANTFSGNNFEIRAVLRDIFLGPEFLSPRAFHAQVKQPVDLVIGSLKALNIGTVSLDATQALRRMGQDLLNPPDVSGWQGGAAWINSTTLFERFNWGNKLADERDGQQTYYTDIPGQVQARGIGSPEALVDYYLGLLVDRDMTPEARQALLDYLAAGGQPSFEDTGWLDMKARGLVHLTLAAPTYQLA